MILRPLVLGLAVMAFAHLAAPAQDTFMITRNQGGASIEVRPTRLSATEVSFDFKGKSFTLPLAELTPESRERLLAWQKTSGAHDPATFEEINRLIGHPLFAAGVNLWEEDASAVASRLKWPQESDSEGSMSYRKYPKDDYRFLTARPYCCTLYGGAKGRSESLSIVFANKGDFNSKAGFGEDHFKPNPDAKVPARSLDEAIDQDMQAISQSLRSAVGEPTEQRYGEKEDRREVLRWNFKEHAFILSKRDQEYVHLLIVDRATADTEGKVKFVKDQDLRKTLGENVKRDANGDVYIANIPMVNQGPKGYCAPATFERAMRYMLVPADMYLLATLATAPGGGTNTQALSNEAKRIISSKARRIKDLDLQQELNIRLVARYIDKGVPVLWQMASIPEYNQIANELTQQRKAVSDFKQWPATLDAATAKVRPSLHNTTNFHICMIIGYNEASSEVAVSDSWGPGYALRWVPLEVARAITTRGGFVIDL